MAALDHLKVGDEVIRMLAGTIPMRLRITALGDGQVSASPSEMADWPEEEAYHFCTKTGAEIDDYLDWGPPPKRTGSFIKLP